MGDSDSDLHGRKSLAKQSLLGDDPLALATTSNTAFYVLLVCLLVVVLDIPLLRPLFGFLLLTILPGSLLVSFSGSELSVGRKLLYSVGLSLTFVMVLVALINFVFPQLGINNPLSLPYILGTITALVTVLCLALKQKGDQPLNQLERCPTDLRVVLLLVLLPLLSILGTGVLLNNYEFVGTNIVLLVIVAFLPLVAILSDNRRSTVLLIWVASIVLLLNVNLVSGYIWGWDVNRELYISKLVVQHAYWDVSYQYNINTMLTYTTLAPAYSTVTGYDLVRVFKIIFPLLFSLVPVGIYYLTSEVFDDHVATLSPFVYMFYYMFFKNMPHKQYLAQIFLVMFLLLLMSRDFEERWNRAFSIVFVTGLVISHYGTTFLSLIIVGTGGVLLLIVRSFDKGTVEGLNPRILTVVLGLVIFTYWYLTVGAGIMAEHIVSRIVTTVSILTDAVNSLSTRSGAGYVQKGGSSFLWLSYRLMSVLLATLIGFGVLYRTYQTILSPFVNRQELLNITDNQRLHTLLSVGMLLLVMSSVILTFGMGFDRVFQIALIVLAPFLVIGFEIIREFESLGRLRPSLRTLRALAAVFLTVYLVLSSGAGFVMAGEEPPRYGVSVNSGNDWHVYSSAEVASSVWLAEHHDERPVGALDPMNRYSSRDILILDGHFEQRGLISVSPTDAQIPSESLLYIGEDPLQPWGESELQTTPVYTSTVYRSDRIYTTMNTNVYSPQEDNTFENGER